MPPLMPSTMLRRMRFALLVLALVLALGYSLVSANGRAILVVSQEKGPYRIDVSILPGQAVVGNTHLSVFILALATGDPVTQAKVAVSGTGPAGATDFGPIPAPNGSSPQFFETDLPFDLEGDWTVMITVASDLGEEAVQVPMNVQPGGTINVIWVAALLVATSALGIWTWDRVRGRRRKAEE